MYMYIHIVIVNKIGFKKCHICNCFFDPRKPLSRAQVLPPPLLPPSLFCILNQRIVYGLVCFIDIYIVDNTLIMHVFNDPLAKICLSETFSRKMLCYFC